MLTPGIYRLSKTIVNPKADRRNRHDWRLQPEFKEGWLFTVRLERLDSDLTVLSIYRTGGYFHQTVIQSRRDKTFELLAEHLVRKERSLDEVYALNGVDGVNYSFIIPRLLEMGRITLDDVEVAIQSRNIDMVGILTQGEER